MLKKIKSKVSDNIEIIEFYNAGVDAFNSNNFELALMNFIKAKERQNDLNLMPHIYYNLALCHQKLGNIGASIQCYNAYLEKKPCSYDTLKNLFYIYYESSDYKNALICFKKCHQIKEQKILIDYINSFDFNNNSKKVFEFLSEVLKSKNGVILYVQIVKTLENERANLSQTVPMALIIDLYKLCAKFPEVSDFVNLSISMCYARINNWDKAVNYAQKVVVANPDSYQANRQLGFIYYCESDIERAINYYKKALLINPYPDYKLYSELAYSYEKAKKYDEAIKQFELLLSKFTDFPAFYEIKFHMQYLRQLVK